MEPDATFLFMDYSSRSNSKFSASLKIGGAPVFTAALAFLLLCNGVAGSAAPVGPEGDAVYLIQDAVAQICYHRSCSIQAPFQNIGCARASGIMLLARTLALAHTSRGPGRCQSGQAWFLLVVA